MKTPARRVAELQENTMSKKKREGKFEGDFKGNIRGQKRRTMTDHERKKKEKG